MFFFLIALAGLADGQPSAPSDDRCRSIAPVPAAACVQTTRGLILSDDAAEARMSTMGEKQTFD